MNNYELVQGMRISADLIRKQAREIWQQTSQGKQQHANCHYPDCRCLGTRGTCTGLETPE